MIAAELVTLTDGAEGFATSITARGPGTGINRMQVTVRNETAITKYGLREAVEDFPDAVDAADLLAKAQARLAEVSDPAKFQQLTVRVSGHTEPFKLGQRVRVSDGELGFATTARITGIDASNEDATLTLGDAPASLLDVLNAKDAEERRDVALGLPAPLSVQLLPAPTGVIVLVQLGANSRAVGVEVHCSPVNGFAPDVSTLVARGPGVRFEVNGLPTAIRQFFRVRTYDDRGNFSPFTDQISTSARGVGTAELVVGQIDITNAERVNAALSVKTSGGSEVLRLGNITGKAGVPAGTQYGLWGAVGSGVFIEGMPVMVHAENYGSHSLLSGLAASLTIGTSIDLPSTAGLPIAITIPPIPIGYRMRPVWVGSGVDLYLRLLSPAAVERGYAVPERWGAGIELRRSNGTWSVAPWADAEGTQYDALRLVAGGRITVIKTTPAAGRSPEFWFTQPGTVLLMFVPRTI